MYVCTTLDKCIYIQIVLKQLVKINDLFVRIKVTDGNFTNNYYFPKWIFSSTPAFEVRNGEICLKAFI